MVDYEMASRLEGAIKHWEIQRGTDKFRAVMQNENPNAATLAWAIVLASSNPGRDWVYIKDGLDAQLKFLLTKEHVAAEQRMSIAADAMAAASLQVAKEAHDTAKLSFWVTLTSLLVATASMVSAVLIARAN